MCPFFTLTLARVRSLLCLQLSFTLKSQEAFGGHGDLTDLLEGLDEYSEEDILMDHIGQMQDAYSIKVKGHFINLVCYLYTSFAIQMT